MVSIPSGGPADPPELQLICREQRSGPLEKGSALKGRIYGINSDDVLFLPQMHPSLASPPNLQEFPNM